MRLFILVLAAASLLAQERDTRHRLPALSAVFPQGAEPGGKLQVEVLGQYMDRAQTVLFLDAAIRGRVLETSHTRMTLEFDVARDATFGPHYFRMVSPRGPSNLLLFRVGDQPHRTEREPNSTLEEAEQVPLPVTINGRLNVDGDFDFYRFRAEQGQTWVFDLRAGRNGNGLDAALILLDAAGRKVAHSEDVFIWDPFFSHTFAKTGDYCVVVQPTHARNDPAFAYQLDIRAAPHLDTVAPISLAPGTETEATMYGAGLLGGGARLWFAASGFAGDVLEMRGTSARVKIRVPRDARQGVQQLALLTSGGRSNPATFLVDSTPRHAGGDSIAPPVSILGVARYRQPERFWFQAAAEQALVFEVRAQRFGSPVDSVLRILDAKGKEIAVNDDANFPGVQFNKDSRIAHKFKEEGRYQLEIRNLWAVSGENYPYQLLVRPPQPDFALLLATDQPYIYPGEKRSLKVTAVRRDNFEEPIRVKVEGLPAGISADPCEIGAGKNDAEIGLQAAPGLPAGTFAQVRIVAEGAAEPAWRSVRIASGGGEGATSVTVDAVTLAVAERAPFTLEPGLNNVNLVRGGMAELSLAIRPAKDFQGGIRFLAENLPAGASVEPVVAPPGSKGVTIRFRAGRETPAGRYSRVAILGCTEDGRVEQAPRISLLVD